MAIGMENLEHNLQSESKLHNCNILSAFRKFGGTSIFILISQESFKLLQRLSKKTLNFHHSGDS